MPPMKFPDMKEITIITPLNNNIPMSDTLINTSGMHIMIGRQNPVNTMAIIPRMNAA